MSTWIGLGGNIGDGPAALEEALRRVAARPGLQVRRRSGFYRSEPWGFTRQAAFTNAVAELDCSLEPPALLAELQDIEAAMGRRRSGRRWGPRTIDLDILLLEDRILLLEGLSVPHPHMHARAFVLLPLAELEPGLLIPGRGTVASCLARISRTGVERIADAGPGGRGAPSPAGGSG
jgi:2-amino-4-hydroxy-6-hydroxymethyldihydropteridine diphosphokinase